MSAVISTHADRQSVDISFAVCVCVCVYVQLRISPPRIKLAASNFVRWFVGVLGRESPIMGNFPPPEVQNQTNQCVVASIASTDGDGMCPRRRTYLLNMSVGLGLDLVSCEFI